jgi:uncharacterized protein (TIGR02646 family)
VKYIQKRSEPEEFTKWKAKSRTWEKFQKKTKIRRLVKNSLLEEQFHLCCYCEQSLEGEYDEVEPLSDSEIYEEAQPDDDSTKPEKSHIEHFQPRSDSAVDPLSYENLLCSCLKDWPPNVPLHCGALKGNWFDSSLLVMNPFHWRICRYLLMTISRKKMEGSNAFGQLSSFYMHDSCVEPIGSPKYEAQTFGRYST